MLHEPMTRWALIPLAVLALEAFGQVEMDVPIQLSGQSAERTVEGLADPTSPSSLLSKGAFVHGIPHWADAIVMPTGLDLTIIPVTNEQPAGTLLRFLAPSTIYGPAHVSVNGAGPLPLVRPDGIDPVLGDITEGMICEIMLNNDRWTLMSPALQGCPPSTVRVNERFCMDIAQSTTSMTIHGAMDHCAERGGRLCRWDEYYHACTTVGMQMTGLFNDWEWIDDTSNHVHIGDQAGRLTCMSQRSETVTFVYPARCCYTKP